MPAIKRVVLVAKPWRGGLAKYVEMALKERCSGRVTCLYTYPITAKEQWVYRKNRVAWRRRLADKVRSVDADLVLFLNLIPEFAELPPRSEYVLWLTDDPSPVAPLLAPFAHVYLSDPGYADLVRQAVGESRFAGVLPFACQPSFHVPVAGKVAAKGFCFVANRDSNRDRILKELLRSGRRVHVYGNYFPFHIPSWRYPWLFRPPVSNERMGKLYSRYLAALNIHAQVVRSGTNMRTFECAAYGVPQLVEHRPGLEALFDPDKELFVFRNQQQLGDLMDRIEANPDEARGRAERARRRALAEHTYNHRIDEMLGRL